MHKTWLIMSTLILCIGLTSCSRTTTEPASLPTDAASADALSSSEGWSETYEHTLALVYGDNLPLAYSMTEIVGQTEDNDFLANYSKLDLILDSNCILLAQRTGDGTARTLSYELDVTSGACALMYDNDEGESQVLWSGSGQTQDTVTIQLGGGANCLRLTAIDGQAQLHLKLECTK